CILTVLGGAFCLGETGRAKVVSFADAATGFAPFHPSEKLGPANSWETLSSTSQSPQGLKNVQVLKGLPESQFFLVMNFVATSLGVQCAFCHVQQGKDPETG